MAIRLRRALVGLATTAAVLALPAVASAAVTPALTVTPSTTTAGTSPATVGLDATFAGGSPNDVTFALPTGLLANASQAGGACLISSTATAACQVGTGTVTAGRRPVTVSLFLVKAPSAADVAGVAVVPGPGPTGTVLSTADVTLRSTPTIGLDIAFSNLAARAISEMNVSLTTLRLPHELPDPGGERNADGGRDQHDGTAERQRLQRAGLCAVAHGRGHQGRQRPGRRAAARDRPGRERVGQQDDHARLCARRSRPTSAPTSRA